MEITESRNTTETIESVKALLAATQMKLHTLETELVSAKAELSTDQVLIVHLKLVIAKLQRDKFGTRSERTALLIDQFELQLEEAEAAASEDDLAAEAAARKTTTVSSFVRTKPSRKPFPEHLPRERVVIEGPTSCACCGGSRLSKLGEDVTETLEVIPRQWKVIQHVREKFSCRDCERISQAPAPFHVIPRGYSGPSLLAMILFEKFGQHQPLNRQSERYAREGIALSVSTLADHVGACARVLRPLFSRIEAHVLAAERLHGDDTTVPVLAKGKTVTGRLWTYVRDDRPYAGQDPPAAIYYYSATRTAEHPQAHLARYNGILQADAYSGYNELFRSDRAGGTMMSAYCMAHARRYFFELADIERAARAKANGKDAKAISPIAFEVVKRLDAIFAIERGVTGKSVVERLAARQTKSLPLMASLETYLREQRAKMSKHADAAKAIDYMLKRWDGFARFLHDGRICLSNNAAERAMRGIAIGRKSWLFCGSDRGGERAALMYSLIMTCKMNDIDPQAWLADVLARIADHPARQIDELLPWNWNVKSITKLAA
jgi:transposase